MLLFRLQVSPAIFNALLRNISLIVCSLQFHCRNEIGESQNKYQILGLNLLFLLSQNRVAEFHTELELLPQEIIQSNEYIRHPLILEQHLMEGNYNKIFLAKVRSNWNCTIEFE